MRAIEHPLAVSGGDVYWTAGGLMDVPTGGGKVETLAPYSFQTPIAVDASGAYTMVDMNSGWSLVRYPLGGGKSSTLASHRHSEGPIALDDTNVYWATDRSASVVAKTGGKALTLASSGTTAIAVDATHVYLSTNGRFAKIKMLTPK